MKNRENNFGLPVVDSTPMGNVRMSVQFYRKFLTVPQRSKPWRIFAIIFGLLILLLGLFILAIGVQGAIAMEGLGDRIVGGIALFLFGLLFTYMGGKALYLNIFK